ncbi:MAG TPA: DUF6600 domain-containing protein [Xanthobacteraceae bacterium]
MTFHPIAVRRSFRAWRITFTASASAVAVALAAASLAPAEAQHRAMERQPGPPAMMQRGNAPRGELHNTGQSHERGTVSAEFRAALEPHGRWLTHSRWGEVWRPEHRARNWRPYTLGHWTYTNDWGWYWIADQDEADWGWVTYHYGRWVFDDEDGWVWVPGTEWGPAFVAWRRGGGYAGWCPLPPEAVVVEYREQPDFWIFVRAQDLIAPRIATVVLPFEQRSVFFNQTVVVNQTVLLHDRAFAVNPGIAPGIVAAEIGRPLPAYDVRPRLLAGTAAAAAITGATIVTAQQLRSGNIRGESAVRRSQNRIQPARHVPPPQALTSREGRLGDNPLRAAGRAPSSTGQGTQEGQQPRLQQGQQQPRQQPAGRAGERMPPTTGQAPRQQAPRQQPLQQQGQQRQSPALQQPRQGRQELGRQQTQPQPRSGTEGRGNAQQRQQSEQRNLEQHQQNERRAVEPQRGRQEPGTQGRGTGPARSMQNERRATEPQRGRQEFGTQGRGAGAERPMQNERRAVGPQRGRPELGTQGRAAGGSRAMPPGPGRAMPSTEGRGGGGPVRQPGGGAGAMRGPAGGGPSAGAMHPGGGGGGPAGGAGARGRGPH